MTQPSSYFIAYEPLGIHLTREEEKVVESLTKVVRMAADLYTLQVDKKHPGAKFYPANASKREIAQAASKNPEILSHFTVVERSHDSNKLIAIPYHARYHDQLHEIELELRKTVKLTTDKELANTLRAHLRALQDDSYEEAVVTARLLSHLPRVRFCFGPMEYYEDKLFSKKYGYQAWVSTVNVDLTERCEEIKNVIIQHRRGAFPAERIELLKKTRVCVEQTIAAGGLMVDYHFSGETLPNRSDLIERYGAMATFHLPALHYVLEKFHMRIFESVFERRFQDGFSRTLLERAFFYIVLLHEMARFLTRFRTGVKRLQGVYPIFNEMTNELLAIRLASYLLLKDVFTEKEFEAILVLYICRLFDRFEGSKSQSVLQAYQKNELKAHVAANVLMLNVLLQSGSMKHHRGISWPNFVRVFLEIDHMIEPAERIFAEGSYRDAVRFIKNHGSLDGIKHLHPMYRTERKERIVRA